MKQDGSEHQLIVDLMLAAFTISSFDPQEMEVKSFSRNIFALLLALAAILYSSWGESALEGDIKEKRESIINFYSSSELKAQALLSPLRAQVNMTGDEGPLVDVSNFWEPSEQILLVSGRKPSTSDTTSQKKKRQERLKKKGKDLLEEFKNLPGCLRDLLEELFDGFLDNLRDKVTKWLGRIFGSSHKAGLLHHHLQRLPELLSPSSENEGLWNKHSMRPYFRLHPQKSGIKEIA